MCIRIRERLGDVGIDVVGRQRGRRDRVGERLQRFGSRRGCRRWRGARLVDVGFAPVRDREHLGIDAQQAPRDAFEQGLGIGPHRNQHIRRQAPVQQLHQCIDQRVMFGAAFGRPQKALEAIEDEQQPGAELLAQHLHTLGQAEALDLGLHARRAQGGVDAFVQARERRVLPRVEEDHEFGELGARGAAALRKRQDQRGGAARLGHHQIAGAAPQQGQHASIEQAGFARPGLAAQHTEPAVTQGVGEPARFGRVGVPRAGGANRREAQRHVEVSNKRQCADLRARRRNGCSWRCAGKHPKRPHSVDTPRQRRPAETHAHIRLLLRLHVYS